MQPDSSAFVADPELIRALETRSTPFVCETERLLFNQDAPAVGVYIVQEGGVTLTMNARDGARIFSIAALPGSLLGLPALISNQPYSLTAIALAARRSVLSAVPISSLSCRPTRSFR